MKYAYLDSANILHITKGMEYAQRDVKKEKDKDNNVIKVWPIVETEFPAKGGYPIDNVGNYYVLYSEKEDKHGKKIPYELEQIYLACK